MRKMVLLFMVLTLILLQTAPAAAEEVTQITITSSAKEVKPGDEVTFTVTIDGGESCRYYGLMLEYDTSVFEMGSGECTVSGAMLSNFDPERGFVVLNDKERVPQGTLGTFTMKVREDAAIGGTSVAGVSAVKSGDESKASAVTGAEVTIQPAGEPDVPETTVPNQTGSSGSQNQSGSQQSTPSGSQNQSGSQQTKSAGSHNTIKIPTFSKNAATTPVETMPEATQSEATTEAAAVPQETTLEENVQKTDRSAESGSSLLPAIAAAAMAACVVLAVILVVKKRKR